MYVDVCWYVLSKNYHQNMHSYPPCLPIFWWSLLPSVVQPAHSYLQKPSPAPKPRNHKHSVQELYWSAKGKEILGEMWWHKQRHAHRIEPIFKKKQQQKRAGRKEETNDTTLILWTPVWYTCCCCCCCRHHCCEEARKVYTSLGKAIQGINLGEITGTFPWRKGACRNAKINN